MNSTITIRKARLSDMEAIHELVKALALYENEPEAVQTSVAEYEKDFAEGIFQALVADDAGQVIGMMLYFTAYSTWKGKMIYLDDFVVADAYRRQGVGQQLFEAFLMEAKTQAAKLVKWQVLDWNEPAIAFYNKNKATLEKNWWNCKVSLV